MFQTHLYVKQYNLMLSFNKQCVQRFPPQSFWSLFTVCSVTQSHATFSNLPSTYPTEKFLETNS